MHFNVFIYIDLTDNMNLLLITFIALEPPSADKRLFMEWKTFIRRGELNIKSV